LFKEKYLVFQDTPPDTERSIDSEAPEQQTNKDESKKEDNLENSPLPEHQEGCKKKAQEVIKAAKALKKKIKDRLKTLPANASEELKTKLKTALTKLDTIIEKANTIPPSPTPEQLKAETSKIEKDISIPSSSTTSAPVSPTAPSPTLSPKQLAAQTDLIQIFNDFESAKPEEKQAIFDQITDPSALYLEVLNKEQLGELIKFSLLPGGHQQEKFQKIIPALNYPQNINNFIQIFNEQEIGEEFKQEVYNTIFNKIKEKKELVGALGDSVTILLENIDISATDNETLIFKAYLLQKGVGLIPKVKEKYFKELRFRKNIPAVLIAIANYYVENNIDIKELHLQEEDLESLFKNMKKAELNAFIKKIPQEEVDDWSSSLISKIIKASPEKSEELVARISEDPEKMQMLLDAKLTKINAKLAIIHRGHHIDDYKLTYRNGKYRLSFSPLAGYARQETTMKEEDVKRLLSGSIYEGVFILRSVAAGNIIAWANAGIKESKQREAAVSLGKQVSIDKDIKNPSFTIVNGKIRIPKDENDIYEIPLDKKWKDIKVKMDGEKIVVSYSEEEELVVPPVEEEKEDTKSKGTPAAKAATSEEAASTEEAEKPPEKTTIKVKYKMIIDPKKGIVLKQKRKTVSEDSLKSGQEFLSSVLPSSFTGSILAVSEKIKENSFERQGEPISLKSVPKPIIPKAPKQIRTAEDSAIHFSAREKLESEPAYIGEFLERSLTGLGILGSGAEYKKTQKSPNIVDATISINDKNYTFTVEQTAEGVKITKGSSVLVFATNSLDLFNGEKRLIQDLIALLSEEDLGSKEGLKIILERANIGQMNKKLNKYTSFGPKNAITPEIDEKKNN